jgi:EAL domain-containing protein (putative c-di-GMP-specific phosphodiesterase class I)
VKAIVAVARGMRKTTIAECVEDLATFEMLKGFGVDAVQGYFMESPHGDHRRRAHVAARAPAGALEHS